MKSVTTKWALDNSKDITIIDVRTGVEFEHQTIPGAINISLKEIMDGDQSQFNKDERYYMLCRSGSRSAKACEILGDLGYDVVQVEGGFEALKG